MTTIAYKDGILAADTQGDWGGTKTVAAKIHRLPGLILAGSGQTWRIKAILKCIERSHSTQEDLSLIWRDVVSNFYDPHHDRDSDGTPNMLLIQPITGNYMRLNGPMFMPCDLGQGFIAIGSGCEYALGAMHAGATAKQAVEAAVALDTNSGGCVEVMDVRTQPLDC